MADVAEHAADPVEHLLALDRVRLDDRPLLRRERPGLVDDLVRDPDLADVVQQRDELGVAAAAASRPSTSATAIDERDDVAAVRARVGVVGLDDVAEQQRRAAVGVAELERLVDARCAARARTCAGAPTSGSTSRNGGG